MLLSALALVLNIAAFIADFASTASSETENDRRLTDIENRLNQVESNKEESK